MKKCFRILGYPKFYSHITEENLKKKLMDDLISKWDGDCKIIHGHARHPQSQKFVEQSNDTLERMMASMMEQFNDPHWTNYLPKIMFNLNTQPSRAPGFTPYEILFSF